MIDIPKKVEATNTNLVKLLKLLRSNLIPNIQQEEDFKEVRKFLCNFMKNYDKGLENILTLKLINSKGTLNILKYLNIEELRINPIKLEYKEEFNLDIIVAILESSEVSKDSKLLIDLLNYLIYFNQYSIMYDIIKILYECTVEVNQSMLLTYNTLDTEYV